MAYAAPELLNREGSTRNRIFYSLGYVVYEMLTGKHAFADQSPVLLLLSHMEREIPAIEGVPDAVMAALRRATAKVPARSLSDSARVRNRLPARNSVSIIYHRLSKLLLPTRSPTRIKACAHLMKPMQAISSGGMRCSSKFWANLILKNAGVIFLLS